MEEAKVLVFCLLMFGLPCSSQNNVHLGFTFEHA